MFKIILGALMDIYVKVLRQKGSVHLLPWIILNRQYVENFATPLLLSLRGGAIEALFVQTPVALEWLHVDM